MIEPARCDTPIRLGMMGKVPDPTIATSYDAPDPLAILRRHAEDVTAFFHALPIRSYPDAPARLAEAIAYSLLAGGKRLRPALVMESFAACGGTPDRRRAPLAAAVAIELIHTFSLVHDDLPAMDDDDLRRGRPTNHKVYGEAMAILAGDAMTTLAFEVLATVTPAEVGLKLVAELAHAAGPAGMIGGQVLDMEGEQCSLPLEELQRLHRMKTGALLTAACRMGAIAACANDRTLDALTRFGQHVGLAFQIVDDLLDVTSTPEQLGKATGKDQGKGKNTYPGLLGLEGSRTEAARQLSEGLDAIDSVGEGAAGLWALARFVVERRT